MDKRDEKTWATLELTSLGEIKVEEGVLEKIIRKELRSDDVGIFIPVSNFNQNGRKVTLHLMEGYIFIETGLEETKYFNLEHTPYFESVFSQVSPTSNIRVLSVVGNSYIEEMKDQLRGLSCRGVNEGDVVKIVKGAYRLLEATVIEFEEENAYVSINLRSLSAIVELPKVYLCAVGGEDEND